MDSAQHTSLPPLVSGQVQFSLEGELGTLQVEGAVKVPFLKDLETILTHLQDHAPCQTLLICGRQERLLEGIALSEFDATRPLDVHGFHRWEKVLRIIEQLPLRTVIQVEGPCVGAAVQLVLACDVRLARPQATFCLSEVSQGFLPGMATWRLGRYIGLGRARRMVLQGETLSAATALDWGLLDALAGVEGDQVLNSLLATSAPQPAYALARRLLLEAAAVPYEEAVGNFLAAQHRAILAPPFQARVRQEGPARGEGGGAHE